MATTRSRTTAERSADSFDSRLYNLILAANRCAFNHREHREAWAEIEKALAAVRPGVRAMMYKADLEATN
jgi:hypothetical protein